MKEAIEGNDFSKIGNLLGDEWRERKKMCKDVSTTAIEDIISFSLKNGAMASKVCGAAGGIFCDGILRKDYWYFNIAIC